MVDSHYCPVALITTDLVLTRNVFYAIYLDLWLYGCLLKLSRKDLNNLSSSCLGAGHNESLTGKVMTFSGLDLQCQLR